jgi:hypothetical protein
MTAVLVDSNVLLDLTREDVMEDIAFMLDLSTEHRLRPRGGVTTYS